MPRIGCVVHLGSVYDEVRTFQNNRQVVSTYHQLVVSRYVWCRYQQVNCWFLDGSSPSCRVDRPGAN